ncbi:MAG: histidine kinase [Polyangia bacterium]
MSTAPSSTRPNLLQGFGIGYGLWFISCAMRWIGGGITLKDALYEGAWIFFLYVLVLGIIGFVFRIASRQGFSIKAASLLSLVTTIPAIAASYLIDFAVTRWDPTLGSPLGSRPQTLGYTLATAFGDSVGICVLLAAIVYLPVFARAHEERDRDLGLLRREAELLRIRSHLEPHFLLNSLNAVAGLLQEDPVQARELLAALGDLFRDATTFTAVHRVRDEVAWLKRYVTIHELRYPDALHTSWEIPDETLEMVCPALILQPLVENAIKHGALRGGGHLTVRACLNDQVLTLAVEDDGPQLGAARAGGRGLSIVRRRLELESSVRDAFDISRQGDKTVARVRLPARLGGRLA